MKLLFDANRDAAAAPDNARSSAHVAPPTCCTLCVPDYLPLSSRNRLAKPMLRHAPCMQDASLPLHHASMNGAPFEVMELLLGANRQAASTLAQARR